MIAARWPRDDPQTTRLLHIDPTREAFVDGEIGALRTLLRTGDLLVVNDAATLPGSLRGVTDSGEPVEVRLAGEHGDGSWRAVLFGAEDWQTRTEDRPAPPLVHAGTTLQFGPLRASVVAVDRDSPRLISLAFNPRGATFWRGLYHTGRPVQYAYVAKPLALWHVQTAYAARPWASEAPSAGFSLTWELLLDLRRRGIGIARITHAAGLSSTGDPALDARLPLPERYDVPEAAATAIAAAKALGGRVVAVGTTVTRALEGAAANAGGRLVAGEGTTDLLLGPRTRRAVVDGILTGAHDAGTSHFALLESFAPRAVLELGHAFAEAHGYLGHEFGDAILVLPSLPERSAQLGIDRG
jgi:S-adenosylmethionine:tRNA ribosyltransferase-isomerase